MDREHIRALLIEDNPGDVRFIREMLKEVKNISFDLMYTSRMELGLKLIAKGGVDVVLLDLGLPDSQGFETFVKTHALKPQLPIVVLSGLEDEELAVKAVKNGAQDYLVKSQADGNLIVRALRYAVERKRAEEQIKASLREKEVMLREIHHRVKNNMQIISSLINLQTRHIKDKQVLEIFKSCQNRVKSMSLIHERLYQSKDFARVDFADYVRSLVNHLRASYAINVGSIKFYINIKDVLMDINKAIPCCLIINELVSNSFKYAFPDGKKGEIKIVMHPLNENEIELIVSDNGVGLPEDMDFRDTESLGLHLVTILTEDQLQGNIKLDRTGGTSFHMRLRADK